MTRDEARSIGIADEHYSHNFANMTVDEACTNRCITCNAALNHFKNARWRFTTIQPCRCARCAQRLAADYGCTWYEARFVV
jgi:hypothetical protein